jgi:hypothetical protein
VLPFNARITHPKYQVNAASILRERVDDDFMVLFSQRRYSEGAAFCAPLQKPC